MDALAPVLLGLGVFVGASTQRVTGLGFALVSSPLLVLVAGPFRGVQLSNGLVVVVSLLVLVATRRDVDVRRACLLMVPALAVVPAGAWVAHRLPAPRLMVLVGGLLIAALLAVLMSERARVFRGTAGAVSAGALSGFMNVTAGVGGPAMVLYAVSSRWSHRNFVASFQLYALVVNLASLLAKGTPRVTASEVIGCLVGLAAGIGTGRLLARRVSADRARQAVVVLALAGAVGTVVKGALTW